MIRQFQSFDVHHITHKVRWHLTVALLAVVLIIGAVLHAGRVVGAVQTKHDAFARECEVTRMPVSFGVSIRTPFTSGR